jgi:L-lactate dehydrogenase (cytochrome)
VQHVPQVQGIISSNHGGRAADTAPPAAHTLLEIRKYCPEVFEKLDIVVDGGIKRGTDVVKALAMGAKAVEIGCLDSGRVVLDYSHQIIDALWRRFSV